MIFLLISMIFQMNAQAEVLLEGKDSSGKPCSLLIEKWEFTGEEQSWGNLLVTARTSWQKSEKPSLVATATFSPYSLYGRNKEAYESIAIVFDAGPAPKIEMIRNYSFQSWSEEGGLLQTYCRFYQ